MKPARPMCLCRSCKHQTALCRVRLRLESRPRWSSPTSRTAPSLWSAAGDAMTDAIEKHDRLLRHMMLLYNGIEVATEGDSFQVRLKPSSPTAGYLRFWNRQAAFTCGCAMPAILTEALCLFLPTCTSAWPSLAQLRLQVIFRQAQDAVRWCIAVQMQLLKLDWPADLVTACPENAGVVRATPQAAQPGTAADVPKAVADLAGDIAEVRTSGHNPEPVTSLWHGHAICQCHVFDVTACSCDAAVCCAVPAGAVHAGSKLRLIIGECAAGCSHLPRPACSHRRAHQFRHIVSL